MVRKHWIFSFCQRLSSAFITPMAIFAFSMTLVACGGGRGGGTDANGNPVGLGLVVRKVSGDNQAVKKNQNYPLPLVARIESPDGYPVPFMNVTCSQTTSTDAVITGSTTFHTDMSGLISTTVKAPSTYDQTVKIACGIDGDPNPSTFTLETAFTVDYVEFVPGFLPNGTYTASDTVAMDPFKVRMIDTDGLVIDLTGGIRHWIDITVSSAGDPAPMGDVQEQFTVGEATFNDVRYIKSNAITLRATHNTSGKYVEHVINVDPNVATQSIAVLPGQTYTNGVMTLAQAVTGNFSGSTTDGTFSTQVRLTDAYFNTITGSTDPVSVVTPNDSVDTEPAAGSFAAGVANFTIDPVQAKAGLIVRPITAFTDNDSSSYTVTPGVPTHLLARLPGQTFNPGQTSLAAAITGATTTQTAGVGFNAQIYATDAEFNLVNQTPTVAVTTSDPSDTHPAAAALVAGTRTFIVTNVTAGTRNVTPASAGYTSNVSSNFTVQPNAATQLVITTQPNASYVAGAEIAPVVEIRDAYNNVITTAPDATADVTMTLFSGTGALAGTVTKTAVAGVADFSGLGAYINLVGTKVIRFTKASTVGGGGTAALTVNSNSFSITHAPATQMAWTTQPTNPVGASVIFSPVIEIRDTYGNVVTTGADATATLTLNLQTGTGALNGTLTKAAIAGVANFAGNSLNMTVTGTKTLRASKPDTTGGGGTGALIQDSASFAVTHGPATKIVYTTQPVDPTNAGAEIAPVLEIQDVYNNPVDSGPDSIVNVTLSLQSGTGALFGTVTTSAVAGVANFAGLGAYINLVGTKVIRATKASTVGGGGTVAYIVDSNSFDITPAAASQLVYTTQPTNNTVAGVDITPIIEIRDSLGNLVTSGVDSTANVTLSLQTGTGAIFGSVTKAAVGGVVTFNGADNVYINLVGSKVIRATKADTTGGGGTTPFSADSSSFAIVHAPASTLVYTTQPANNTVAGTDLLPVLEIRDAFTNVVTSGADATASVTITLQTGTGVLSGTNVHAAASGIISFVDADNLSINIVGTKTLRATKADTSGGGGTGILTLDSNNFDIIHAAPSALEYTLQPVNSVAGTDLLVDLKLVDSLGNTVTTGAASTANVTLTKQSGTGTLAGTNLTKALVAGVVSFGATDDVRVDLIGSKTLRASDGTRTVDSNAFTISHAAANSIAFTTQPPDPAGAGFELPVVVTILDAFSNTVTSGADATANIALTINSGTGVLGGTSNKNAVAGVANFTGLGANINTVGTKELLATKADTTGGGGTTQKTVVSDPFEILHGAAAQVAFVTQPTDPTIAGADILVSVEILDSLGNRVTTGIDSTATVTLNKQTGTGTLAGTVAKAAVAGLATFTAADDVRIDLIGTKTLRATKSSTVGGGGTAAFTTDSNNFDINHAPANSLSWTTQPASGAAGTNLVPVVKILDAYTNIVTSDNASVITLSIQTDPSVGAVLAGDVDLTVSAGVATWTGAQAMFLNKSGTGFVLRASDGTRTADSAAFNVTHAAANSLSWTTQPASAAAGTNLTPVVKILDTYGNVIDSDNASTITLSIQTDPSVGATLAGTKTRTVVAGVATWTAGQAMFLNKIGTGFVLRATDGTRTADSAAFNVTPAAPASLTWTTEPASGAAGTNLTPVVKILDTYSNVVETDNTSTITLTIQTDPSVGATLAGDVDLTVTAGVATWAPAQAMFLNKIGNGFRLQASDGTRTANSALFNVTPAAPASLSWTTEPSSGAAGTNLTPVVKILDTYSNVVNTDNASTITLTIQTDPSVGATLAGDVDLTVAAGVATWTGAQAMFLNKIGTGFILQASDGTRTANSAAFNVTPAAANSLSWTTQPASGAAGTNLVPVVKILDTYGNVRETDNASTITLTIQTDPSVGATLAGDVDLTVTAGVATWTATEALYLNKIGTGFVLRASDGTRTADSAAFNVTPAAPASLSWTTQPASAAAGTNLTPVVKILDTYSNVVETDNASTITLSIQTDPSVGATLAGDVDLTVTAGVATWTGAQAMFLNKVGTGFVLRASDGTRTADSSLFNVTHAAANSLSWTTQPATGAAGVNLTPVVKILDTYSNVVTSDNASTITLSIQTNPGASTLAGDIDLTVSAGVATWTGAQAMYLNKVGTAYVLQASDGTRTANSAAFNVTHAAASEIVYSVQPTNNTAAGAEIAPTLTIRDTYGNTVTSGPDSVASVSLSLQSGTGSLLGVNSTTAIAGVANFTGVGAYIDTFGAKVVRATKASTVGGGGTVAYIVDSNSFDIIPGAANSLSWTTQPATGAAGTNLVPVVKILDAYNNILTGDNASVITLTIQTDPSVGATLAGDVDLTVSAGVATWTGAQAMFLNKIGTGFILRASDGTRTADSNAFNVTPAAANSLSWTTQPASGAAGTNLVPVVKILDTYGNVRETDNASTITLTIQTDPSVGATLAGDVDLTVAAGVATWTATETMFLNKVGTGFILRASDGTRTANSAAFNVTHAAASSLSWATPPATGAAGTNLTPVVQILDTYGNVVTSDNASTITLSIQTNPGTSTLAGDVDLVVAAGVATWTGAQAMYLNKVGTGYVLQATDGTRTANSSSFNVTHAAANSISFTTQPPDPSGAGFELPVVVSILDIYGNVVTSGADATANIALTLESGTGALGGTANKNATAGVANFTGNNVNINATGTKEIRATKADTTGGGGTTSKTVVSNTFDVLHGAADHLSVFLQPVNTVSGEDILVTIEVRDSLNNRVTTGPDASANIALNLQTGTGALAGTVSKNASLGLATFAAADDVRINLVGTKALRATKASTVGGGGTVAMTIDTNNFDITHGAANSLSWTAQPSSGIAGTNLTPEVKILDAAGNIVTSDNASTITLTIQTDPSVGATLAGDVDLTVTAGVATWTGAQAMFLNKIGNGFVLQASDGTRTANSVAFNVTPAAANSLSWTTQPASGAAGTNLVPVVKILDTYGNVRETDNASTITLTIQTDPSVGATLAGDVDLTVSAGVATWTGAQAMFLNKIGNGFVLRASDGTRTADSAAFNVTPSAPTSLSWTTQPASGAAGTNLTPVVKILDTYSNVVDTDNTSVITLTIQTDPSVGATLAGDVDLTVTAGVATWAPAQAMFLNKIGNGFVLRASDGTRTADSNAFNVTPAAANSLSWTTQPASAAAGTNLTPVVKILDTYGNVRETDNASIITLTIQTDPSVGATLAGDVDLTVAAGVATWAPAQAMFLNKIGNGFVLQASDGTRTANSATFNVTPAAANSLSWTTQPATGAAGTNLVPVVKILDTYGNVRDTDNASTITLTIQTDPSVGATLAGDVDLTVSAGVATWTAGELMFLNKIGNGFVLRASDGTRTADSNAFNVTPAAANSLSWTTQPATGAAGTNLTPVVKILDTYGNVRDTDNASTITLTIQTDPSVGATLAGDVDLTVTAGVATWAPAQAMFLNKIGTGFVLRASDGTRTADSAAFNVTPAAANSLSWTTQPATGAAGTNLTPVVKILDAYSNVVETDNTSIITLTIQTDPSVGATLAGDVDLTVSAGVATWAPAQAMFLNKSGTGFRLQASDGTRTANSALFNVTHAAATEIVYSVQPTNNTAAGAEIAPTLTIRDTYGNTVTSGPDSVASVSLSLQSGTGSLLGVNSTTAIAGVANFTGVGAYIDTFGAKVVRATKASTVGGGGTVAYIVDSNSFDIIPGAANSLSWTTQPATGAAGTNLVPVVKILDAYNNILTGDNTSVITLTIQTDPSVGATLAGDVDLTVTAGVATWAPAQAMFLNKIGNGFVLRASDGTRTADSNAFNVTPAAANSLSWTTQPATGAAGTNLTPVVKILDTYGNVRDTDNASTITLTIQTDPSVGATLAGDVNLTVAAGVATWTATEAMFLNKIGNGFVLQASDGTRTANSAAFNVTPAAANSLSWTTQPATGAAGTNLVPVVKILDTYGNVRETDNASTITLTIQTDPSVGATLAGDVDLTVSAGVATWTGAQAMFLNKIGTGFVLRASDGTRTADSNAFNVTPAAANSLSWTTQPASGAAGTNLTPVVKILDTYSNVVETDNASVITLTIQTDPSVGATLAGDVDLTVTAGVATWAGAQAMFLNKIGTGFVLRASDGTRTADSNAFNVTPAAANSLSWTTQPASGAAGTNLVPVVKILDTYSNVVDTDNTSVITLTIQTDPSVGATLAGDVDLTVTAGVATWAPAQAMFLNKIGTGFVLRASDGTRTADSNAFNVTPAAPASLSWTTQPTSAAAGTNLTPVVKILDSMGNVVETDNASTITLTIQTDPSVGATLAGDVDLTVAAGVATWAPAQAMFLNKIGTGFVLRASDGTRTADSNAFNVTPAAANSLSWTTQPATGAAGVNLTPVIKILDTYGNVRETDNASTITLTIQTDPSVGATLAGDVDLTVTAGVATWTATEAMFLNKIGNGFVLRASDGTRTADSNAFNVTPAAANSLSWTTQPASGAAGTNLTPVVKILDTYGNVRDTDNASTITLTIQTDPSVGATLAGDVDLTVTAGVATWAPAQAMFLNKIGTGFVLRASDGTRTADSAAFNVTPAAANSLSWTTQPATGAAGVNLTPVVKILDTYGNVRETDNASTITLTIQTDPSVGATLAGDVDLTVAAGVATWAPAQAMFLNKIGTGFILQASDGTRTADSAAFNVTPAAANSLSWTTQPATGAAGVNLTPVVKILDTYSNVVDTDNTSVITLTIQTDPSVGATLAGDVDLTVTAGVATWAPAQAMFLNKIGTGFILQASDGTRTANSAAFNVTPAAANSLSWTTQPASAAAGTNLTPVVKILDAYGNVRETDNASTITLTIQTDPSVGATLAGDVDLTVAAGVATWAPAQAMFLNKIGTGFILQASDGTRTANSAAFNVTPAAANSLSWTTQPASGAAGTNLTPVVKILDTYGNVRDTDNTSTITLTIQTDPSVGATLAGDVDLTVSAGVATWTAGELMFLNKIGTGFILQASDGTRTANSAAFNVTPAAANSLSWTTQPASGAAGTNLTPVVKILDTYGNVRETDNASTITLTIQTDPSVGATLAGDVDLTVAAGVATWAPAQAMFLNKIGTGFVLRASDGTRTADSNAFNVTPAAANSLSWTTQPASGIAGTNLTPVVKILDTYGNVRETDNASTITLTIQTDPSVGATLAGDVDLTVAAGVATWAPAQAMFLNKIGTGFILQASDGTRTANSAAFNVTHAPATNVVFSTSPASSTAGANLLPVVTIRDTYNNTVSTGPDSTADITLTINSGTGGATLSGTAVLAANNGVATWTATESLDLDLIGAYTLRATKEDTSLGGGTVSVNANSSSFNITHSAATQIVYTQQPADDTAAGDDLLPILEIRDSYGNLVSTGADATADVTLTLQTGTGAIFGTVTKAAVGGVATYTGGDNVYINFIGAKVLRATKANTTGGGGTVSRNVDSSSFDIIHGAAAALAFTTSPATSDPATDLLPVVEIRDAFTNLVSTGASATATVTLTLQTGTGALLGTNAKAASGGVATFIATDDLRIEICGSKTLRATVAAITQDSSAFTINCPAAPSALALNNPSVTPENDSTPEIRISGVVSGNDVELHTNSSCSAQVGSGTAAGTTIDLTSSALTDASYTFYARQLDAYTNYSACSTANVAYVLDLTNPSPGTALTLASSYAPSSATSPLFSWTASASGDATTYEVALGTSSGGTDTVNWATASTTTSHTFGSLSFTECSGGTPVYYPSVRVTDAVGNQSTVATHATGFRYDVTDPGAPGVPTTDADANTDRAATATWTAATDNCQISHYEMAVGSTSGGTDRMAYTNIGNVTSYQPINGVDGVTISLSAGTYYYTSIRTVDQTGRVSSVVTSDQWRFIIPPSAITNVAYSSKTKNSIEVAWTAPSSNGTPIIDYLVEYKETSSGTWLDFDDGVSTTTSVNVTGLTPNTSYDIRVRASNGGISAYSNTATIETAIDDPFFEPGVYTAFNLGGATASIVAALDDNTTITKNGVFLATLNAGDRQTFVSANGDILEADKPIYVTGRNATSNANDREGHIVWNIPDWAGKNFQFNGVRNPEWVVSVYAFEDADVDITGAVTTSQSITAGNTHTFRLNAANNSGFVMTSTGLVTGFMYSEGAADLNVVDALPLIPPAKDYIGFPSASGRFTTSAASTATSYWHGNTNTTINGTLTAGTATSIAAQGTSQSYQCFALRIQANDDFVGQSNADSDGNFTAPFLPISMMRKRFVMSSGPAEWVALASDVPAVIRYWAPGAASPSTVTLTRTGTHAMAPYNARLTGNVAGSIFESDQKFAMWYETDDDTNGAGEDEVVVYGNNGTELPVNHKLKMWLDGQDATTLFQNSDCTTSVVTTNGQDVGCWRDKSPQGNHATQAGANKPTWQSNVPTFIGEGGVDFNGGTNYLQFAQSIVDNKEYTIFAVIHRDGTVSNNYFMGTQSAVATKGLHLGFGDGTTATHGHDGTNIQSLTVETQSTNSVGIFYARLNSAGKTVYFNGKSATDAVTTKLSGPGQGVIGLGRDTNGFDGQIGEIIVYDRALSAAELTLVQKYLQEKWFRPSKVSDMRLWLDANDTTSLFSNAGCSTALTAPGAVGCWSDKSGAGYQALVASGVPQWNVDSARNAVLLTNDSLVISAGTTGALFENGASVTDLSIISLARSTSTTESGYLAFHGAGSDITASIPFGTDTVRMQVNGSGNGELQSTSWGGGIGQPYMWSFINDVTGTGQYIYRDGTTVASDATTGSVTIGTENFYIGSSAALGNFQNANVHELMVFKKTLTADERAAIRAYLMNKWLMP